MSSSIIFNASGVALICFLTGPFRFRRRFFGAGSSVLAWLLGRQNFECGGVARAAGLGSSTTFDSSGFFWKHDPRGRGGGFDLIEVVAELHRTVFTAGDVDVEARGQALRFLLATVHLHQFSLRRFSNLESLFQSGKHLPCERLELFCGLLSFGVLKDGLAVDVCLAVLDAAVDDGREEVLAELLGKHLLDVAVELRA